jgi:hypothetical protein
MDVGGSLDDLGKLEFGNLEVFFMLILFLKCQLRGYLSFMIFYLFFGFLYFFLSSRLRSRGYVGNCSLNVMSHGDVTIITCVP